MKTRWFVVIGAMAVLSILLTTTLASANTTTTTTQSIPRMLYRCDTNYSDEELAAIQENGDDGYEPDDCPLLAHVITGPMLLNFCQPGDEDWVKFKAEPNTIYQLRAEPPSNYPTEPHLELYIDNNLVAQNDHYFNSNAEIWWWNSDTERFIYARVTELRGRHDCGNSSYTLSLHAFPGNSYTPPASTPTLIPSPTLTLTNTITPTATLTPTDPFILTSTDTLTPTVTPTPSG